MPLPPGAIALCASDALRDGGLAVPFEVLHEGVPNRAFAVRHEGQVAAFLNRCTHVAMELDWQPNRVFDSSGEWLICASHGAIFHPTSGECMGGACNGGLVRIALLEQDGQVWWLPDAHTVAPEVAAGDD